VTVAPATPHGHDTFVAAYEALRRRVCAGASCGSLGLVLLLREGLAAWMAHGAACSAPVEPERRVAAPIMSNDEIDATVVRVLANMALGGLEEMRA
jgi:hypothetical protein